MEDSAEPVKVFIRIRPEFDDGTIFTPLSSPKSPRKLLQHSHSAGSLAMSPTRKICVTLVDSQTIRLTPPDGAHGSRKAVAAVDDKQFTFDAIFPEQSTQEEVYEHVSSLVRATVRGYNTTIFAYGSTGSGKSYTMTGNNSAPGIIPRAVSEIFSIIETTAVQESDVYFYVRMSYVELYNNNFRNLLDFGRDGVKENLTDTLNSSIRSASADDNLDLNASYLDVSSELSRPNQKDKIEVRESVSAGVFLAGPNLRIPVTSAQEAFQLIARGNKVRATGFTQCNDLSSRSHAILTIHVESRLSPSIDGTDASAVVANGDNPVSVPSELRLGKMHLVDLAGSERLALSQAEGETLIETQNINLSLTALGDVLSALSKNASILAQHNTKVFIGGERSSSPSRRSSKPPSLSPVPYRNSKLTHLLKDSLGGNSKTIMITNVRTLAEYYQQTAISLMYASRAKKVRNKSHLNRNVIGDTGIHAVSQEIERLRSRLEERSNEFDRLRQLQMHDAEENVALKAKFQALQAANDLEKKQLEAHMKHVIHSQAGQLVSQRQRITQLQQSLQGELMISHNKIAEQEKEIKWLKRALDESTEAAQQPADQLERMQRVADAWQAQAKTAQKELSTALETIQSLQQKVSELSNELESNHNQIQATREDASKSAADLAKITVELQKNATEASLLRRVNGELSHSLKSLESKYEELTRKVILIPQLESDIATKSAEIDRGRTTISSLTSRLDVAETEKKDLRHTVDTTMSMLEKKTSLAIESATKKLGDKDKHLALLTERLQSCDLTISQGRNRITELEKELLEIQTKYQDLASNSHKVKADELILVENRHRMELQEQRKSFESKMTDERERSRLNEIKLNEEASKFWKDQEKILISRHAEELELTRHQYQERLKQTEDLMRQQIDEEIDGGVKALKLKHTLEISQLKEEFRRQLDDESTKERNRSEQHVRNMMKVAEEEAARNMKDLESRHQIEMSKLQSDLLSQLEICRAESRDSQAAALRSLRSELLKERSEEINALKVEHRIELESCMRASDEKLAKATKDFEKQKEAAESMIIEKLEAETLQRIETAVAETKAKYQAQLKSAVAAHKSKLDDKYREKISGVSEQEDSYRLREKELEDKMNSDIKIALEKQEAALSSSFKAAQDSSLATCRKEKDEFWSKEMEKLRRDLIHEQQQRLNTLEEEFAIKLTSSLTKQEAELTALHQRALVREVAQLEKVATQVAAHHKSEISKLTQKHDIALAAAVKDERDMLKKLHSDELSALRKEFDEKFVRCITDGDKKMESTIAELKRNLSEKLSAEYNEKLLFQQKEHERAMASTVQEWRERFRTELSESQQQNRLLLQQELDSQRAKVEAKYTSLLAGKDEMIAQLHDESKAYIESASLKLMQSLANQQTMLYERHQLDLQHERDAQVESEQRHEQKIKKLVEEHQSALVLQRQQMKATHDETFDSLKQEYDQLEEKYNELLQTTVSSRGLEEIQLLKTQSEQFDILLQQSLQERDEYHKALATRATELFETEKRRLVESHEREIARLRSQISDRANSFALEMRKAVEKWRLEHQRECERLEIQHREELSHRLIQWNADTQKALAEVRSSERNAAAARTATLLAEIDTTKALQGDLSLALAKQRADFEREKLEVVSKYELQLSELDQRHLEHLNSTRYLEREDFDNQLSKVKAEYAEIIDDLKSRHSAQMSLNLQEGEKQRQDFDELLAKKLMEKEQENLRATEELTASLKEKYERDIARVISQHEKVVSTLLSKQSDLEVTHSSEIQVINSDWRTKLDSLQSSFELKLKIAQDQFDQNEVNHRKVIKHIEEGHSAQMSGLEEEITRLRADFQSQKDSLLKELDTCHRNTEIQLMASQQSLKLEYEKKITELSSTYDAENTDLRDSIQSLNDKVVALKASYEREKAELNGKHLSRLQELELHNSSQRRLLEESFERHLERAVDHHKEEIDIVNESNKRIVDHLRKSHEVEKLHFEQEYERLKDNFAAQISRLSTDHTDSLESIRKDHENEILEWGRKLRELNETHQAQIRQLKIEHDDRQKAFARDSDNLLSAKEERLNELSIERDNLQLQLVETKSKFTESEKIHASTIEQFREQMAALTSAHESQIAANTLSWNQELDGLARQVVLNESLCEQLRLENGKLRTHIGDQERIFKSEILKRDHDNNQLSIEMANSAEEATNVIDNLSKRVEDLTAQNEFWKSEKLESDALGTDMRRQISALEDEVAALMSRCLTNEKELDDRIKAAVLAKEEEIRSKYFDFMQQQVDCLNQLIQVSSNSRQNAIIIPQMEEMHERFMKAVQELPQLIRGTFADSNARLNLSQLDNQEEDAEATFGSRASSASRPRAASLSIVAGAALTPSDLSQSGRNMSRINVGDHEINPNAVALPKPSISSKSSPIDQLIAAIFDGDIQGIRSIVRSHGDDLRSEFWKKEGKMIMPLHRAIAGLHFHGSAKTLLSTLETLLHLHANILTTDNQGNTVLHKAILVCTSKHVVSVVQLLVAKGADVNARNKNGDMAIHIECKGVRSASVEVIGILLRNGCNANVTTSSSLPYPRDKVTHGFKASGGAAKTPELEERTKGSGLYTPLSLVLLRASELNAIGGTLASSTDVENEDDAIDSNDLGLGMSAGQIWVQAAEFLVQSGAHWSPNWSEPKNKNNLLHLLLASYPPPSSSNTSYRYLLNSAISAGCDLSSVNGRGKNAMMIFAERLSALPYSRYPESTKLFQALCASTGGVVALQATDWTGASVSTLRSELSSCLHACRPIIQEIIRHRR